MVCQACGAPMAAEVHFCPKCGVQVAGAPLAPPAYAAYPPTAFVPVPRVQRHLQTLGILWCVFGAYRVASGLIGMFFLRAVTMHGFGGDWPFGRHFPGPFGPPWMGALLPVVAVVTVVGAVLAFLVGYSLLTRRPWGRVVAIIIAILTLIKFPFGTALGIYTLWVLAPSMSGMEYDAIADRSGL
jgi:hypothetical protein